MLRTLFLALLILVFSKALIAQSFAPGKLVKIKEPVLYPFDTLSTDSLIGREYILLVAPPESIYFKSLIPNKKAGPLQKIFSEQASTDSLLAPWVGRTFTVAEAEQDTGYRFMNNWYIRAKFSPAFAPIIKTDESELIGGEYEILSISLLQKARNRWQGKSLWLNVPSDAGKIPALSHIIVERIDPEENIHGPYAFHLRADNGDTETIHCALQNDGSKWAFGNKFGSLFLEQPPQQFWKTVPVRSLERNEVTLGEDSSNFFQTMKKFHIHTFSYNVTYSQTGTDSIFTTELMGSGIWGINNDSSQAWFFRGKLSALTFKFYDSTTVNNASSELRQRFGEPTVIDSSVLASATIYNPTWYFYLPDSSIQSLSLSDLGPEMNKLGDIPKNIPGFDIPKSILMEGIIFYGNVPQKSLDTFRF